MKAAESEMGLLVLTVAIVVGLFWIAVWVLL